MNTPANKIGCPECGTTVESTWWECPQCGTVVQGKWWKSSPEQIKRNGTPQSLSMLLAGLVCLFVAPVILSPASFEFQLSGWQRYFLAITLAIVGLAFIRGMYFVDWWYADKSVHEVVPFQMTDSQLGKRT